MGLTVVEIPMVSVSHWGMFCAPPLDEPEVVEARQRFERMARNRYGPVDLKV